jgi:hypothetical protein
MVIWADEEARMIGLTEILLIGLIVVVILGFARVSRHRK